jgi:DNA end-binding protein Ku
MAPRAYWKGHLRLSLVTIKVELYSAVSSASKLSAHQIHEPSGKRIRYQKVAPGIGPVDKDEIVKGYELDNGDYVLLSDEDLDAIKLESRQTINLVQFVEYREIDPRYFDRPYYVVPADDVAAEGFAVIREALRKEGKVGLGQMAVRGRDNVVALKPCGDGLLLETLRYAEELRAADSIFDDIPDVELDSDMLDLATELIERKTKPFDASAFKSEYVGALRELIEEKRKTGDVSDVETGKPREKQGNVVNLMDALKKSLENDKGRSRKSSGSAKSSGSRSSAGSRTSAAAKRKAK